MFFGWFYCCLFLFISIYRYSNLVVDLKKKRRHRALGLPYRRHELFFQEARARDRARGRLRSLGASTDEGGWGLRHFSAHVERILEVRGREGNPMASRTLDVERGGRRSTKRVHGALGVHPAPAQRRRVPAGSAANDAYRLVPPILIEQQSHDFTARLATRAALPGTGDVAVGNTQHIIIFEVIFESVVRTYQSLKSTPTLLFFVRFFRIHWLIVISCGLDCGALTRWSKNTNAVM